MTASKLNNHAAIGLHKNQIYKTRTKRNGRSNYNKQV